MSAKKILPEFLIGIIKYKKTTPFRKTERRFVMIALKILHKKPFADAFF